MNHIKDYFNSTLKNIFDKSKEKEAILVTILDITNIKLERKDVSLQRGIARLKVFGSKRSRILTHQDKILLSLKEKGITLLRLE